MTSDAEGLHHVGSDASAAHAAEAAAATAEAGGLRGEAAIGRGDSDTGAAGLSVPPAAVVHLWDVLDEGGAVAAASVDVAAVSHAAATAARTVHVGL